MTDANPPAEHPPPSARQTALLEVIAESLGKLTTTETTIGKNSKIGLGIVLTVGALLLGAQASLWSRFDGLQDRFASREVFEAKMEAQAAATAEVGRKVESLSTQLQVLYRLEAHVEDLQVELRALRDRVNGSSSGGEDR